MHQFIERTSGEVVTERLVYDRRIKWMYSRARELAPKFTDALLRSPKLNDALARLNFDRPMSEGSSDLQSLLAYAQVDTSELAQAIPANASLRQLFCRKIRYWETRPMPEDQGRIVSPSDARILFGSFCSTERIPVKEKFLNAAELLDHRTPWATNYRDGCWTIFRLTPEEYHYNHFPVSGEILDFYEIAGAYHSCNPAVMASGLQPLVKNHRHVTIVNTDICGGSRCGVVAIVEVAALLIGRIDQVHSSTTYRDPRPVRPGMRVQRGAVKSLFTPGSSTVVVLFEADRISMDTDLIRNQGRLDAVSRYSKHLTHSGIETRVKCRQGIARSTRFPFLESEEEPFEDSLIGTEL